MEIGFRSLKDGEGIIWGEGFRKREAIWRSVLSLFVGCR